MATGRQPGAGESHPVVHGIRPDDRHKFDQADATQRFVEHSHALDDPEPVYGRRVLQGPLRDRRGDLPDPAEWHDQAALRRLHLRGPDAHGQRLFLGGGGLRRRRRLLATSAQFDFTIHDAGTQGSSDYLAPTPSLPLDPCAAEADTPTLSWNAIPNAGWYEVTVANDAAFSNQIRKYGTAYTVLTPRESYVDSQSGQGFFWFVRPCVDVSRSRCGPDPTNDLANNNASAFKKISSAVELATPADSATVANQVTFTWTDFLDTNEALGVPVHQEARTYKIEVSLAADFSSIFDTATVDQTTYTPFSKTYPEGPLYWRVQTIDNSSNTLTKSPARVLNKVSPEGGPDVPDQQLHPVGGAVLPVDAAGVCRDVPG